MKIAILGDVHFGISNSNEEILKIQLDYFENELFPYLNENGIKYLFQLGDLFDNKMNLNSKMLKLVNDRFFNSLIKYDIKIHMLLGNHDIYEKDNKNFYSSYLFTQLYKNNFTVYKNIKYLTLNNKNLLIVPWLQNYETLNIDNYSDVNYVFGHFEINDVEMSKGITYNSKDGIDMNSFKSIKTFSGHFHLKRYYPNKNIFYVGNAVTQLTWSDFNEEKGVHILDLETDDLEFIESKTGVKHLQIEIDSEEKKMFVEGFSTGVLEADLKKSIDYSIFKNHNVKIFIQKDNAFTKKVIEQIIEQCNKYKVKMSCIESEDGTETTIQETVDYHEFDITGSIKDRLETEFQISTFNKVHEETLKQIEE